MSKKDFELIASILADWRSGNTPIEREVHKMLCEQFASRLADTNPRFNRERFIAAAMG